MRDQIVSKRVDVLHHLVGEQFAIIAMDDLVNIHTDAAIFFGFEINRFYVGLDQGKLPRPVGLHRRTTVFAPALHAVRPAAARRE